MNIQAKVVRLLPLIALLLIAQVAGAHTINYAMEEAPAQQVLWFYLKLGVTHIIPYGIDHILFVVCLCLLQTKWKTILWQATAFTIAHSITLALSSKGIIQLPAQIVEPIIALSILYVAIENLMARQLNRGRLVVIFLFGLIHGLGFASALNEIGLPRNRFFEAIIGFNLGVELGQIMVIAIVFGLFILPFRNKALYQKIVFYPSSLIIILMAGYWTWQRISGV